MLVLSTLVEAVRRHAFVVCVVVVLCVIAVAARAEPVRGDGWNNIRFSHVAWGLEDFIEFARSSHDYNNPRWGQLFLVLAYRTAAIDLVVTPLVLVGLVLLVQLHVRGQWPRDARWFAAVLGMVAVMTPQFGAVWFYRPVCTNYVYPLVAQLAWLVPYRLLVAREDRRIRGLLCLAIVPLGFLAGAGNEHTGPALGLAAVGALVIAWRRDRTVPLWGLLGIAAMIGGSIFLITAPGQSVRYDSLAEHTTLFSPLLDRGVPGNARIVCSLIAWTSPVTLLVGIVAWRVRYRPSAATLRVLLTCVGLAAILVGTSLLSPKHGGRLLVAPAIVLAIGCATVVIEMNRLRGVLVLVAIAYLGAALVVHVVTGVEGRARVRAIETAAPGSVLLLPRYTFFRATPLTWGDDFRNVQLRGRIEQRYGLRAITWR